MKINPQAIPGTVHLVDQDSQIQGKHDSGNKEIVLNPTPSDDPDDPLNWTRPRKYLAMFCMVVYTFGVGIASASIYSVLTPISTQTGLGLATLNQGTGYMFLFLGLGCFFWQPMALQYGKRPVYLISLLATALIIIWSPHTNGNGSWIGGKILQGFFGAPIESLLEVTVSDIWFEHERGRWMNLYALALVTSNYIAPLVAGFIADGQGWEWVIYWSSIWAAVCFVFCFFFMEETNYSRQTISPDDVLNEPSDLNVEISSVEEQNVTILGEKLATPAVVDTENGQSIPINTSTKTFVQKMTLFRATPPMDQLWINFKRPISMFRFPVILWSGFIYGVSLVWFNVLNATASMIFTNYYNFTPAQVGLTYISPVIGSFIFSFYAAWASDWFKVKLARRNNGVSEAEHRLWVFLPNAIFAPAGLILWGVGASHYVHWMGPVIAMGMIGGTTALGCSVPCSYTVDSYREMSGHGMVVAIIIRNLLSFAIGYGITPWITNTGVQNTFIAACFISLICTLTFLIFIIWGKASRNSQKEVYWRYVQEALDKHMAH